jgi:hypothetical protein
VKLIFTFSKDQDESVIEFRPSPFVSMLLTVFERAAQFEIAQATGARVQWAGLGFTFGLLPGYSREKATFREELIRMWRDGLPHNPSVALW